METSNSDAKHAVFHAKTSDEGREQLRLLIQMLKSLFACGKPQVRAGTHIVFLFLCLARCYVCSKPQMTSGTHTHL